MGNRKKKRNAKDKSDEMMKEFEEVSKRTGNDKREMINQFSTDPFKINKGRR